MVLGLKYMLPVCKCMLLVVKCMLLVLKFKITQIQDRSKIIDLYAYTQKITNRNSTFGRIHIKSFQPTESFPNIAIAPSP